jgi:hypothetical protein
MPLSYTTYQADGNTKQFAVPFGYLRRSHVFVFVDGIMTGFKWASPTNIEIDPAPADAASVKVQRLTDKVNRITDFADGQTLLAGDLDAATLQNFYLVQEMIDGIVDGVLQGDVLLSSPLPDNPATAQDLQELLNEAARNSPVIQNILSDAAIDTAALAQEIQDRQDALLSEQQARIAADQANADDIVQEQQARVAADQAEADARIQGFAAEAQARNDGLIAEADARAAGLLEEARKRKGVEEDLEALYAETARGFAAVVTEQEVSADEIGNLARQTTLLAAKTEENEASILTEQQARTDADSAIASDVQVLQADISGFSASLSTEAQARIDEDEALSQRIDNLNATFVDGDFTAAITAEETARANADEALSQRIDLLSAEQGESFSLIFAANTALISKEEATSEFVRNLQSSFNDNVARIDQSLTTQADDISANAGALTVLTGRVGGAETAIINEAQLRTNADSALASDISTLTGRVGDAEADILSAASLDLTRFQANLERIEGLQAELAGAFGGLFNTTEVTVDATEALVRDFTFLQASVGENEAAITQEAQARANADSALAQDLSTLTGRVEDAEGAITTETGLRVQGDEAIVEDLNTLTGRVGNNETLAATALTTATTANSAAAENFEFLLADVAGVLASSLTLDEVRADETGSLVRSVDALSLELENNYATIQTVSRIEDKADDALQDAATADGKAVTADGKASNALSKIEASYTVRIDVDGNVTGFGLSNDGVESEFAILANRFLVSDPGVPGGTPQGVFLIENGNVVLNSARIGTASIDSAQINDLAVKSFHLDFANLRDATINTAWIGTAQIKDAAITNAKIGNAAISSAKIQDAAITNAKIGDAAITNAKIGDAQINTLKIAGKSVTSSDFGKWANAGGPWQPKEYATNTSYQPWRANVFEVPITGVQEPGREVMIAYDYDIWHEGQLCEYMAFWEKLFLVPQTTSITSIIQTQGLVRSRIKEERAFDGTYGNRMSTELRDSKARSTVPRSGSSIVTMPVDADTVPYKAVFMWHLDTNTIPYSNGNQYGMKNWQIGSTNDWGLEDLELHCIHFKR